MFKKKKEKDWGKPIRTQFENALKNHSKKVIERNMIPDSSIGRGIRKRHAIAKERIEPFKNIFESLRIS